MAVARTQTSTLATTAANTTLTTNFASNPTAGDKIVLVVFGQSSVDPNTPTDDGGNTYVQDLVQVRGATSDKMWIFHADNIALPGAGTLDVTVTYAGGSKAYSIQAMSYSGVATGSPSATNGQGITSVVTTGNSLAAGSASSALHVGGVGISTSANPVGVTTDAPFGQRGAEENGAVNFCGAVSDQLNALASQTCVWDWTGTIGGYVAGIAAWDEAGAAPSTTGEKFPTSGTTTNESPWLDEPWVNPGNVVSNNTTYAQVTATTFDTGDQTAVLKAYGFDFSAIPSGATITGVTCRIEARGDSTSVSLDLVQLLDVSRAKVGTNLASTPQALTTSDAVYTFGGSSNLWGNSLTEAWVKDADFGVAIGAICSVNNSEVYVDYVTLEVWYTAAGDATVEPAVIARSFTAPQAGAGVGAAPAVIARSVTTPAAGAGVGAAPAVVARSVTTPQAGAGVGAAPTVVSGAFTLPQASPGSVTTTAPAVIARSFTTPQAGVGVGAAPAVTARSFTTPQVLVSVGAVPAVIARAFALPQASPGSAITAAPAVIARSFTTPQALVSVAAAPAVVARSFTLPNAPVSVGAAPAVLVVELTIPEWSVNPTITPDTAPAVIAAPQATPNGGAGPATVTPAVIARVFTVPQLGVGVGAAPAVMARVLVLPQAAVGVGASPVILAALVAMPAAAASVGAAPSVIARLFALPQATNPGAGASTAAPAVIARVFTVPQLAASVGAAPAVINVGVTTPQPAESVGAAPALIVRAIVVPQLAASVGAAPSVIARAFTLPLAGGTSDTTVTAVVIARQFVMPQATGDGGAVAGTGQPAVIGLAFTVPQIAVSVQSRPLVIARSFTVPAPSVFSLGFGNPAVIARSFVMPQPAVSVGAAPLVIVVVVGLPFAQSSAFSAALVYTRSRPTAGAATRTRTGGGITYRHRDTSTVGG